MTGREPLRTDRDAAPGPAGPLRRPDTGASPVHGSPGTPGPALARGAPGRAGRALAGGDLDLDPLAVDNRGPVVGAAKGIRLALAGGGTGGHVHPGLHLLDHLAGSGEVDEVLWLQAGRSVEDCAFEGARLQVPVERVVLRLEPEGGGAPTLPRLMIHTGPAVRAARKALRRHGSQVVLGLGGFTCLPAVLAARSLGLPVALFEINAVPGRATRTLTSLARRVFHAWPPVAITERERWTGPPLAAAFCAGPPDEARARDARRTEGFRAGAPLLLVLGGSQGARPLNRFVVKHVDVFARRGISVLHQTGPGRLEEGAFEREGYRRVEYLHDVPRALSAATLVLCRGGASTLAEVGALQRPAFVVPYPHHPDRHQELNAQRLGEGARIVPESRLDGRLARELARVCGREGALERERMSRALAGLVPTDGAARLWRELRGLARAETTSGA